MSDHLKGSSLTLAMVDFIRLLLRHAHLLNCAAMAVSFPIKANGIGRADQMMEGVRNCYFDLNVVVGGSTSSNEELVQSLANCERILF